MRGEFGSISRKGFEVKFVSGMRSRSHRVVQESCWANLPPEVLRDVLIRIDDSENTWPSRKNVVACAGVCRNWREIMKEIVKSPEVSGKLTFPISLKQPGPRNSPPLQCFIKWNHSSQTYYLYLGLNQASTDDGKFLLAARKCRCPTHTDYIISLNSDDVSKGSSTYVGILRSNFLGTKFTIFDVQPPHAGVKVTKCRSTRLITRKVTPIVLPSNYAIAHISYELNDPESRNLRRMHCFMDAIPKSAVEPGGVAPTPSEFLLGSVDSFPSSPFFRSKSIRTDRFRSGHSYVPTEGMLVLTSMVCELQCFYLNFDGLVTVASVKNFQLVDSNDNGVAGPENVILQLAELGNDVFVMDYQYPISAFQAFAICLSSFDTKIACE